MNELRRVWWSESVNGWRTDNIMAEIKGQMDKQWFTKHYTENQRSSNTNPTKSITQKTRDWETWTPLKTLHRKLEIEKHEPH